MELSVVVPAYEEAARLGASLDRILAFLAGRGERFEVLGVDDGSRDATADVAARFVDRGVVVHRLETNRGKGAALRVGVLASRGRRVLLTDADLSAPIEDLPRLEARMPEAELVLGSRAMATSRITRRQPLYRELMGKTFNLFVRLAGVRGLHDTQCGFKLLDGEVARDLFRDLTVDRFAYDVELVWLARQRGHRVVEEGVRWADSPDSRVHAFRDSLHMMWDLVRLRLRTVRRGRASHPVRAVTRRER
jgi:dolichyl-phosphate beta-glucosyltransferase